MENIPLNYFDIVIAALVLFLGIKGFVQGFLKEVFGLVGIVAGVYFASRYADIAATFVDTNLLHLENTALLKLIGFLVILIIIWMISNILGSIFSKLASVSGLGFLNRLFGFVAGGGKYFLIFALIITALSNISLFKDNMKEQLNDSLIYPYLMAAGSYLINIDPNTLGVPDITATESNVTKEDNNNSTEAKTKETAL